MKLPAYHRYKPSNVEWLGDVPEHWETQHVRFCYSIRLGKMLQPEPSGPDDVETPYLKSQHVQWERVRVSDLPTMWTTKAERKKYAVEDGDLLVCEGGDVGRAAVVCNAPDGTIIQNALHRVRSQSENEVSFLLYVLEHAASQSWFEIICNKSTIAHFTVDKFGALGVALPSPREQRAIVDYLNVEMARMDLLVRKKQRLIERLTEKRSALISRTVTRGLPPAPACSTGFPQNPPLKDSGVEWIGEMPKHWTVMKVKFVAKMESGHTPSRSEPTNWIEEECVIPWVSLNDTKFLKENDFIGDTAVKISEEGMKNSSAHLLPPGVVVFTRDATIGLTAITTCPAAVSQHIIAWVPGPKITTGYLLYSFKAMQQHLDSFTLGSTLKTIGMTDVNKLVIPIPPIPEQAAIAAYLGAATAKIDALIRKVEEAIERLQEYRTALITAAVTGKIDVRKAAS